MTEAFEELRAELTPAEAAEAALLELQTGESRELEELTFYPEEPAEVAPPKPDIDDVIRAYNAAFAQLDLELGELRKLALKRRPPRERRTGAAARVNPDDIRVFYGVLVGSLLLPLFTFAASFAFQRAFGAYTPLDEWWWWIIPCILELPLVVLTPMILVFRRRHESTVGPWATMIVLTLAAAAINFQHSVVEQGLETPTDWLAALFIASWPLLTLVTFKFFARLAVKPEPKPTPDPAPPARKTTTRKAPK